MNNRGQKSFVETADRSLGAPVQPAAPPDGEGGVLILFGFLALMLFVGYWLVR
jgi:hypothetical protein